MFILNSLWPLYNLQLTSEGGEGGGDKDGGEEFEER